MAYARLQDPWPDGDAQAPVDGAALTHIEDGIEEAHNLAAVAQATADAAAAQQLPFVRLDTFNQKGDLIVGQSFGAVGRVAVGSGDQTIFRDDSTPTGIAWASITASRISGFPSDASKFLRGDGTWAAPSGGIAPGHLNAGAFVAAQTITANRAYLVPIPAVVTTLTLTGVVYAVATAAGNLDFGIYHSDDLATFTRLGSTGSFAMPSAGVRLAALTPTITPVEGRFWFLGAAGSSGAAALYGGVWPDTFYKDASFPLPASLTSVTQGELSAGQVPPGGMLRI